MKPNYRKINNNKRIARLENEIKNYADLEKKIQYLENLKLCSKSIKYKEQIDREIKNIIKWWKLKGNVYYG